MAATFLVASLLTARLLARHGSNVLVAGALLQALGLAAVAVTLLMRWPDVDALVLAPGMIVAGFGQGLLMSPLFGFILAGVPAERAGVGTGILTTTQQTALALGVATLGTLFLSLSNADGFGVRDGFVVVLAIQIVIALVVAAASRALPRPPAAPATQRAPEQVPIGEAA
jgi:hypothetical protein